MHRFFCQMLDPVLQAVDRMPVIRPFEKYWTRHWCTFEGFFFFCEHIHTVIHLNKFTSNSQYLAEATTFPKQTMVQMRKFLFVHLFIAAHASDEQLLRAARHRVSFTPFQTLL